MQEISYEVARLGALSGSSGAGGLERRPVCAVNVNQSQSQSQSRRLSVLGGRVRDTMRVVSLGLKLKLRLRR